MKKFFAVFSIVLILFSFSISVFAVPSYSENELVTTQDFNTSYSQPYSLTRSDNIYHCTFLQFNGSTTYINGVGYSVERLYFFDFPETVTITLNFPNSSAIDLYIDGVLDRIIYSGTAEITLNIDHDTDIYCSNRFISVPLTIDSTVGSNYIMYRSNMTPTLMPNRIYHFRYPTYSYSYFISSTENCFLETDYGRIDLAANTFYTLSNRANYITIIPTGDISNLVTFYSGFFHSFDYFTFLTTTYYFPFVLFVSILSILFVIFIFVFMFKRFLRG